MPALAPPDHLAELETHLADLQQLVILQGQAITLATELAAKQGETFRALSVCNDALCVRAIAMGRDLGRVVAMAGLGLGVALARWEW